ncbi:MAG: class I SAM-dependent methyltransferase [Uliginosibacterium sp.]|nr:class I SAM-dependent methyltransferase [Uliginosibacterium sp.]
MASPLLMMHFLLETFAQGLPARVPEPEMLMRDAAQVDAYAAQGRQHGFLAPLHLYHAIQASAFICPGDVVLDLACGPGNQLMQIARMNPAAQFIGIDASAEMLDQAQQLQACEAVDNLSFQRCLLPALSGVASHSVDAVICTMALHHLPDLAALAATFRRDQAGAEARWALLRGGFRPPQAGADPALSGPAAQARMAGGVLRRLLQFVACGLQRRRACWRGA